MGGRFPGVEEGVEVGRGEHQSAGMAGGEAGPLLVTEPVVQRDERDARQGRPEQGDGVSQVVGAQVEDRGAAPEPAGRGVGEAQQPGGGQRPAARRDRGPITG